MSNFTEDTYWRRYRNVLALLKMASDGLEEMAQMRGLCRKEMTFPTQADANAVAVISKRIHGKSVRAWMAYEHAPCRGDLEEEI